MIVLNYAPTVRQPRGKGPRTKKAARRRAQHQAVAMTAKRPPEKEE